MMNKWIGLGIAAAVVGVAGCVGGLDLPTTMKVVKGTGKSKEQAFEMDVFTKIRAGGALTLNFEVGEAQSIKVVGDEALFDHLTVKVEGDELVIQTEANLDSKIETVVTISVESLDELALSGALTVTGTGVDADDFRIDGSGASKIMLEGRAGTLVVEASVASNFDLSELVVDSLELDGSGASKFEFGDGIDQADVGLSGASTFLAGSMGDLTVHLSGASKLTAKAKGDVRLDVSGASKVSLGPEAKIVERSVSGASSISTD